MLHLGLMLSVFMLVGIVWYWLFTGSSILVLLLFGGLPLGNVLVALSLVAPSLLFYVLLSNAVRFRYLRKYTLVAAVSWLPLSTLLAGNLQLTFHNQAFLGWIGASALLVCCVMLVMVHSLFYLARSQ